MTTANENQEQQPEPNPYNKNAAWDDFDETPTESADSLFRPPKKEQSPETTQDTSGSQGNLEQGNNQNQSEGEDQSTGFEKRYFDLKSHHDKTVTELRNEVKQLKQQQNKETAENFQMPKNEEELNQFKEKNPDLYDTIIAIARQQAKEEDETVKTKLSDIEKREQQIRMEEAAKKVREAHPDFERIKQDDGFHRWAESKSEKVQSWIYENPDDAQLAIDAINLYKFESGKGAGESSSQESPESKGSPESGTGDAASLVSTRTQQDAGTQDQKTWTKDEINKMSLEEFEQNKEAILKQMRQTPR